MKKYIYLTSLIALLSFQEASAQTLKALSYDVSNNAVAVATNTNPITFKNPIAWATNSHRDATRTNLGLGTAATNPASAFQPANTNLTALASGNGSSLTNVGVTASNVTGVVALANGGTGATNASGARSAIGLGATNNVTFRIVRATEALFVTSDNDNMQMTPTKLEFFTNSTLALGFYPLENEIAGNITFSGSNTFDNPITVVTDLVLQAFGIESFGGEIDFEEGQLFLAGGASADWNFGGSGIVNLGSISFSTSTNAAITRTNLNLGAAWLTNSTAPLFWASVPASATNSGTAGQIAYTNNHLYICISNNTWRRVQLGTW